MLSFDLNLFQIMLLIIRVCFISRITCTTVITVVLHIMVLKCRQILKDFHLLCNINLFKFVIGSHYYYFG